MSRTAAYVLQRLDRLDAAWNSACTRVRHYLQRKMVHAKAGRRFEFIRTWIGNDDISGRSKRIICEAKRLTVVIVTYQQPAELICLLHAFATQTLQNFELLVFHDGAGPPTRAVVQRFIDENPLVPCKYVETDRRYNDYGHTLRQMGIEEAACEYILITNGDNYYAPRFVEFVFAAINQDRLDLVLTDMIHSHYGYVPFFTSPLRARIDMGSFVVRTDMAKRVGFRDRTFEGDATYLEDLLQDSAGPSRVGKLAKTLLVHN